MQMIRESSPDHLQNKGLGLELGRCGLGLKQ
jgi:hypothetical protein